MTTEIKNCTTCGHYAVVRYMPYCQRLQKQLGYSEFGKCTIDLLYYTPKKKWWKVFS